MKYVEIIGQLSLLVDRNLGQPYSSQCNLGIKITKDENYVI